MFAVNVKAIYFGTREALKRINDGGRIVNISSIVAKHAFPDLTAYNATKGAVEVLTFNFAKMAGERNITVNAVAPGATLTDMAPWLESPDGKNMALSQQSLKRIGQPTDIAEVVLALAAGMGWVTGQSIDASGGWAL
jgi:3-oxoacyl-[acyl-carrier protein] reductase